MQQRTCERPDCQRPHRARGLCSMHWKHEHGRPTEYPITCIVCGCQSVSSRPSGKFCFDQCKSEKYAIVRPLPRSHPVMVLIRRQRKLARARPVIRSSKNVWVCGRCDWCGVPMVSPQHHQALVCSLSCSRKKNKARRRALAAASDGVFTRAQVEDKWLMIGRCCGYCRTPTPFDLIDADHVWPLSRGGSNDVTNIVPSCRECNRDKHTSTLTEWADDRAARGLPQVSLDDRLWPTLGHLLAA